MFLRDYEYVAELARTGSILKAAQKLCISSSALSKYVRGVEEELGMPLFDRSGKIFTLTYAGERYLARAQEILIRNQEFEKEMRSIRDQQSGRIRLGFPRVALPLIINQVLPAFRSKHPQISLILHEDATVTLQQMLLDNELEMIMTQLELDPDKFERVLLARDEVVLVVNRSHPLSRSGVPRPGFRYPWVDLRRFAGDEFVLCHPNHKGTELVQNLFDEYGISPPAAFRAQGVESCLLAVTKGLGVTITTAGHAVREYGLEEKLAVFSLGEVPQRFDRMLVYRRGAYLSQAEQDLIRLIQDLARGDDI